MKTNRRAFLAAAGSAAAGVAVSGRVAAQSAKTIVFGGSIPMSGSQGDIGSNVLEGYKIAIKFINEKLGGVKVAGETYRLELQMFDDASDPQRATTLIQKQVDSGVNFFLGSFSSGIVLPTSAITERAKRPMVQAGGGSDQIFTRKAKYMFGMYPRASRQLIPLVELMKAQGGLVKTCSLVTTNDSYSKAQADGTTEALKAAGIEVKDTFKLPATVNDLSGVVNDLRARTPDAIISTMHEQESALLVQQLASTGTDVKLLFLALGPESKVFRDNLGKFAEGISNIQYWQPQYKYTDPVFGTNHDFYEYYKANSTRRESYQTVAAAACIVCYVEAMKQAGSIDPEKVRDKLAALDFESAYGRIKFTPEGDGDPVIMGPAIGQIQAGEVDVVFPATIAERKFEFPIPSWSKR